ncbi:MAG: hypothetical protein IPL31_01540 [Saprospiraceae bacterium]|nr:hypothetical protein [Saprospiraceae bacterium]
MENLSFYRAGLFTAILVTILIGSWEYYLRAQKIDISYDDGGFLWSNKRAQVYSKENPTTVFIGSSRIKYGLDIPTWKKLTGENAIQLSVEGSSPLPVLKDLANDELFHGKLIIDVTEGLFFSTAERRMEKPNEYIEFYKNLTPAQSFSFKVNTILESQFVFLNKDYFSLNALLDKIPVPKRTGVFSGPDFPMDFRNISYERQSRMTDKFIADTNLQNKVKGIWKFLGSLPKGPPLIDTKLDSFITEIKTSIDKIKQRGGIIVFIRTPSSGPFLITENKDFPREQYWNKLLTQTNCPGIHFSDYPETSSFICPEYSHLSKQDAVRYTTQLIQIIKKEKPANFNL